MEIQTRNKIREAHEVDARALNLMPEAVIEALQNRIGSIPTIGNALLREKCRPLATGESKRLFAEADRLYWEAVALQDRVVRIKSWQIARKFNLEYEDVHGWAVIGAYRAALRFNPDRGFIFGTYVHAWIWNTIQRHRMEVQTIYETGCSIFPMEEVTADHPSGHDLIEDIIQQEIMDLYERRKSQFSEQQQLILMRHLQDWNNGDIGREIGMSREGVRLKLNQILDTLRADFK